MPKMILNCQDRSDRVLTVIKTRLDNDVIDYIDDFMQKMKLSYLDRSDQVWSLTKTKQDKNVINCAGAFYIEDNTELL